MADKGAEILEAIINTASGGVTKSEALGLGDHMAAWGGDVGRQPSMRAAMMAMAF